MLEEFLFIWILKNLAHTAGCFEIKSHLSWHSSFSRSIAEKFMSIDMSKSDHFVSAADSDMNRVGMPSCQTMAITSTSFFLASQYARLLHIVLKM